MWSSLLQTAFLVVAGCVVTAILHRVFNRSVLDNIPGPPSKSFLTGTWTSGLSHVSLQSPLGNTLEYYNPTGWRFHRELEDNYGGVVLLRGLFNVRGISTDSILCADSRVGPYSIRLRSRCIAQHRQQRNGHLRRATAGGQVKIHFLLIFCRRTLKKCIQYELSDVREGYLVHARPRAQETAQGDGAGVFNRQSARDDIAFL